MDIHERIRKLRQEKKWTQAELAERVKVQQKQISAYETGQYSPSTDVLIRLADAFDVSLDYLAFSKEGQNVKIQVKDRELLRYFEILDEYPEEEKKTAKDIIDLVIAKHKFKELAGNL